MNSVKLLNFNGIVGTDLNAIEQERTRQGKNFGSEGWGFESLQAGVV
jgi:hypothetical protein